MTTSTLLIEHAKANLWCAPMRDNQSLIEPQRLSPVGGVLNAFNGKNVKVYMPTAGGLYHLFTFGSLSPSRINLSVSVGQWVRLDQICQDKSCVFTIYLPDGRVVPMSRCYVGLDQYGSVLLAVNRYAWLGADFDSLRVFFRSYDGKFFESDEAGPGDGIAVYYREISTSQDITEVQNWYNTKMALPGFVHVFVNGYHWHQITNNSSHLTYLRPGHVVEMIHDTSVYKIVRINLADLPVFLSEKDGRQKYLFNYTRDQVVDWIEYFDDIDFTVSLRDVGVHLHKPNHSSVRQLTHRDYALAYDEVEAAWRQVGATGINNVKVTAYIKRSDFARGLQPVADRTDLLYRMSDADITGAMVGSDATLSLWQAKSLENSGAAALMGMQDFQINNLVVANAYGYHVVCETFAKALKQVYVNQSTRLVDVDPAYQLSATALEYDAQGLFLGAYAHVGSVHYYPTNLTADRVEFLSGAPASALDEVWANVCPYDPYYDWRVYALESGQWVDFTAESTIGSNQIQAPPGAHLIRTNKNVLYQHLVKPAVDGTYIFPIEFAQPGPNGTTVRKNEVNPGQWRAYLNGYYLTQGLDFDIRDGVFYLLSRQYLVNAQTQDQVFDIFAYGLADTNLQTQEDRDAGFCYQGKLSVNGVYNVREHKVNIGFVAGKLVDLSTMRFEEDVQDWVMNSPLNGKPYCIESALVNTRSLVQADSYALRAVALDVDKQVSNYLTGKFTPAPPEPVVNPIENRHALYSVFLTKLITAIVDGEIAPSGLPARYTSSDVRQMVQPYMWLYEYDALNPDFTINSDFVAIYPHPFDGVVELSVLDYAFINHVVTIFGNGRTQLTGYVSVSS